MMAESWMARARGLTVWAARNEHRNRTRRENLKGFMGLVGDDKGRILYGHEAMGNRSLARESRSFDSVSRFASETAHSAQDDKSLEGLPQREFFDFGGFRAGLLPGQHHGLAPVGVAAGDHHVEDPLRSEEHTSELQSQLHLVC